MGIIDADASDPGGGSDAALRSITRISTTRVMITIMDRKYGFLIMGILLKKPRVKRSSKLKVQS
jgi:hypothetical protein